MMTIIGSQTCTKRVPSGPSERSVTARGQRHVAGPADDELLDLDLGAAGDKLGEQGGDLRAPVDRGPVRGDHAALAGEAGRGRRQLTGLERRDER